MIRQSKYNTYSTLINKSYFQIDVYTENKNYISKDLFVYFNDINNKNGISLILDLLQYDFIKVTQFSIYKESDTMFLTIATKDEVFASIIVHYNSKGIKKLIQHEKLSGSYYV